MELNILHLYPESMNLYGEYANLLALKRALEQCGQAVEITPVAVGETVSLADAALVYAGAGTESRIAIAACILCASTETTFYTISVYFGKTSVKYTKRVILAAVFGDLVGILCACALSTINF